LRRALARAPRPHRGRGPGLGHHRGRAPAGCRHRGQTPLEGDRTRSGGRARRVRRAVRAIDQGSHYRRSTRIAPRRTALPERSVRRCTPRLESPRRRSSTVPRDPDDRKYAMSRSPLRLLACAVTLIALSHTAGLRADDPKAQAAPKGELTKYTFDQSKIYPGT